MGELKLNIDHQEEVKKVDMYLEVCFEPITDAQRLKISETVHNIKNEIAETYSVRLGGALIKNLQFYHETLAGKNSDLLNEIANMLTFEDATPYGSRNLYLHGAETVHFVDMIKNLYEVQEEEHFSTPTEPTFYYSFSNQKQLTADAWLELNQYFSTTS